MGPINIFKYNDYIEYINDYILSLPKKGRGFKQSISEKLGIHVSYISRVSKGEKNFTIEQAVSMTSLLHLKGLEKDFFLTLVSFNRAGSYDCKKYYEEKLQQLIKINGKKNTDAKKLARIPLSEEDLDIYTSDILYSLIHLGMVIPKFQTISGLKKHLPHEDAKIEEVINFLIRVGLIDTQNNRYFTTEKRFGIADSSKHSQNIVKNQRYEALKYLGKNKKDDLFKSMSILLSKENDLKINSYIFQLIADIRNLAYQKQEPDTLRVFNLDYFKF